MIPKIIVQYWNSKEQPSRIQELMQTWRVNNPGFDYVLFDRTSAGKYIQAHYGESEANLFLSASLAAMQSDIFRIAYILKEGGIYVDAATRCDKAITPLIDNEDRLILMRKGHGRMSNTVVAAPPDHHVVRDIWASILFNMESRQHTNIWKATGPGLYNTEAVLANESKERFYKEDFLRPYFRMVHNLEHKLNGKHWSEQQLHMNIYGGVES